jgi:ABC-type glycerol-3-phosphate transport system substrate-binding protein
MLFNLLVVLAFITGLVACAAPTSEPTEVAPVETEPPATVPEAPVETEPPATAPEECEEQSITVWGFVWTADWLDAIAPGFEAQYPCAKVVVERFEYEPYQDMVLTTLASGEGVPDVVTLDPMWAGDLIRGETLVPLDKASTELNVADFVPGGWNMYQCQGVQYGIPLDLDFKLMFYRKDVYDAAMQTLGMTEFPRTTDDFLKLATEVVKETGKPAIMMDQGDYYQWYQSFLTPLGGNLMNDEGTEYIFNNDVGVEALQLYSDVVNKYQVGKLWDYDVDGDPMVALSAGDMMAIMNGSWFATEIESGAPDMAGQWSIEAIPWGEAGREYDASTGGACLSIPINAANPDLAWEFIKYSMTPENQVEYFKIVAGVPSLKTSWTDPAFDEVNPYFGIPLGRAVADWSLRTAPMQLPSMELSDLIGEAITQVTTGAATPQDALDEAVAAAPPLE